MRAALVLIVLIAISLVPVAGQDEASLEWIVSVTPTVAYALQPLTFKVYAHDPANQIMYYVTCNVVITNATDVVQYIRVAGKPIIMNFYLPAGDYLFRAFCAAGSQEYHFSTSLSILYPEIQLEHDARWGRPLRVLIRLPYPYTGLNVTVAYAGAQYTAQLVGGEASFTLPAITKPEVLTVRLLGRETVFAVTPQLPTLHLTASTLSAKPGQSFDVMLALIDDEGIVPVSAPAILHATQPCTLPPPPHYTLTSYTVTVSPDATPGECVLTAEVELYRGARVWAHASVQVAPPVVIEHGFNMANVTKWDYLLESHIRLDHPTAGNLTLYVNGQPIASDSGFKDYYAVSHFVRFNPGVYFVKSVFQYPAGTIVISERIVSVPKFQYVIIPPKPQVYAGEDIVVPNADYYIIYANDTVVVLHAIYPGDELHYPSAAVFVVRVIHPAITLTESRVEVSNGAPGSRLEVYCRLGGSTLKIVEAIMRNGSFVYSFPKTVDCDYVYAVYRHGSYEKVVYANEPEGVTLPTNRCKAGEPCLLLLPSQKVTHARVGGVAFKPGELVRLAPGVYTLTVHMSDGTTIERTITVDEVKVTVHVYREGLAWIAKIDAPPWVEVDVVLASGLVLRLKPGVHTLPLEPVSAYWRYGEVELIKYGLVWCPR